MSSETIDVNSMLFDDDDYTVEDVSKQFLVAPHGVQVLTLIDSADPDIYKHFRCIVHPLHQCLFEHRCLERCLEHQTHSIEFINPQGNLICYAYKMLPVLAVLLDPSKILSLNEILDAFLLLKILVDVKTEEMVYIKTKYSVLGRSIVSMIIKNSEYDESFEHLYEKSVAELKNMFFFGSGKKIFGYWYTMLKRYLQLHPGTVVDIRLANAIKTAHKIHDFLKKTINL